MAANLRREVAAMFVDRHRQPVAQLVFPVNAFTSLHHQPAFYTLLVQGVPEDLLFFYQSIRGGGGVLRVDHCLLVYRYHEKAATHSVTESVALSLHPSVFVAAFQCYLLLVSCCHMTVP